MAFQFYCPQGHTLTGEETQIGQACQCPYCGTALVVPSLTGAAPAAAPAGFPRSAGEPVMQPFQPPGATPGIPVAPRPQFEMPSAPSPGFSVPSFPAAPPPAASFQTETVEDSGSAFALPPTKPLDLGFDPSDKNPLPFELPDSGAALPLDTSPSAGLPFDVPGSPPPESAEPIAKEAESAAEQFAPGPGGAMDVEALISGEQPAEKSRQSPGMDLPEQDSDIFHIPCPSGHVVTITRKMLGKTAICSLCRERFQLRYEKSIEYQEEAALRRDQKEQKTGQVWLAWSIAAAVLVLIGVIVLVFSLSR